MISLRKNIVPTIGLCVVTLLVIATSESERSNRVSETVVRRKRGSSIVEASRYLPSIGETRNGVGHGSGRVRPSSVSTRQEGGGESAGRKVEMKKNRESREEDAMVNRTANDGKNVRVPSQRSREDYYARRKAAMERFYAREREIAEMYSRQLGARRVCNNSGGLECGSVKPRVNVEEETRIDGGSRVERREQSGNVSSGSGSSNRSAPNRYFRLLTEEPKIARTVPPEKDHSNEGASSPGDGNSSTVGRQFPQNNERNGENETLNRNRAQPVKDYTEARSVRNSPTVKSNLLGEGDEQRWGRCNEGELVYRHNLILGVKNGSSTLDATFEVILQGSTCISCVEVLRNDNNGRATVRLIGGGRGHRFARLGLKGFQNEGFSYIVQIWALSETADQCEKRSARPEEPVDP